MYEKNMFKNCCQNKYEAQHLGLKIYFFSILSKLGQT